MLSIVMIQICVHLTIVMKEPVTTMKLNVMIMMPAQMTLAYLRPVANSTEEIAMTQMHALMTLAIHKWAAYMLT